MNKFIHKQIDRLFKSKRPRPVIIVFREKHEDVKFACLDRNELECVCLTTLWERYHMGYYCDFDSHTPNLPPISKGDIEEMSNGITKDAAREEWKHYETELAYQKEMIEQLELVKTALCNQDGAIAFAVLQTRSDGEYEGFEVEPSNKIEDLPEIDLLNVEPKEDV